MTFLLRNCIKKKRKLEKLIFLFKITTLCQNFLNILKIIIFFDPKEKEKEKSSSKNQNKKRKRSNEGEDDDIDESSRDSDDKPIEKPTKSKLINDDDDEDNLGSEMNEDAESEDLESVEKLKERALALAKKSVQFDAEDEVKEEDKIVNTLVSK